MSEKPSINKQIAKNAAALYFRMFITMLVGFYTSRVLLQALGIEDYGIYTVVGGFVSMFSLISNSLQTSVGRFMTFELGAGNKERLKGIFSTSFFVMVGLSFIVVLATETFGLWYLYNKMVIPAERQEAAFWCFQFSLASFILQLLSTPYSSSIISHEKMSVYAYISILDVVLKLAICYGVMCSPIDKLIFYALLLFIVGIIDQAIYWTYCRKHFEECVLNIFFDKKLFKQMFGFAGWNFIGSSAAILRNQGANLLYNAFGGPLINAANGIAGTICGVVASFVNNFTQAFNPQITKQYAAKEYNSLMLLLIRGSKFSYYLMFVITLPVVLNIEFIIKIWLGVVPEYAVPFSRWVFVFLLAESISRPIITAKNATGQIRNYQIVVGGILLLMLPISYIGLKMGLSVTFVAITNAFTSILALFTRIYILRGDFPLWSSRQFLKEVIFKVSIVSLLSSIAPILSYLYMPYGWINFLVTSMVSVVSVSLSVLYLGCNRDERKMLLSNVKQVVEKMNSKSKRS